LSLTALERTRQAGAALNVLSLILLAFTRPARRTPRA
jgi:hypothetical protein